MDLYEQKYRAKVNREINNRKESKDKETKLYNRDIKSKSSSSSKILSGKIQVKEIIKSSPRASIKFKQPDFLRRAEF